MAVVTTTSERYADRFGFTEEEVLWALDQYGMSDREAGVKEWYDGFTFGSRKDIYNPWSITSFLNEKKYKAYWANTSENALVDRLLKKGTVDMKCAMEQNHISTGGSLK